MVKTPQQIKNEVEKEIEELIKGCGEPYGIDEIDLTCYEDNLCNECENKLACCRDKLSILTEYDKSIKEMIESCDEEPCCHGIQKNELLSQLNSKEKGE